MNIIDFLENNVRNDPNKIAIISEGKNTSYKELDEQVQKICLVISALNNQDIISLISENSISFVTAYLGIIKAGKIVHIVPSNISEINLLNQIKSAGSQLIICSKSVFDSISRYSKINIPILQFSELKITSTSKNKVFKKNEIAHLIYTSGTTFDPKGVGITYSMLEFTTKNIVDVLGYSNSDIDVLPLPLYHSFGLGCFYTSISVGATLILHKDTSNLDNVLDSFKKFNATTVAVLPATLTKLLKFDNKELKNYFSDIRLVITNSTVIPKNTILSFKEILKNGKLATYYGLTEASRSTFMIFQKDGINDESVGKTAPGVNIKIMSDSNSEGEIWIKGKNVITKYWNNEIADKNLVNGWLRTGDIGYLNEQNFLFLKGRKDDIINVGGEKVIPYEIEEVIKQIQGVEDAVAYGIENEIFGQVIKLQVVKSKGSDLDKVKILIYCIKNLEKFKIPTKIDFVDNIPKTDYGKVKRFMLK